MFFFRASNDKIREWFLDACVINEMVGELSIHFNDDTIEFHAVNFTDDIIPHVIAIGSRQWEPHKFHFDHVLARNTSRRPSRKEIENTVEELAHIIKSYRSIKQKIDWAKDYIEAGFDLGLDFNYDFFIVDGILLTPNQVDKYVDFCAEYAEKKGWIKDKGVPFNKESMHKYIVSEMAHEVLSGARLRISSDYPRILAEKAYDYYDRIVREAQKPIEVTEDDDQCAPIIKEIRDCCTRLQLREHR